MKSFFYEKKSLWIVLVLLLGLLSGCANKTPFYMYLYGTEWKAGKTVFIPLSSEDCTQFELESGESVSSREGYTFIAVNCHIDFYGDDHIEESSLLSTTDGDISYLYTEPIHISESEPETESDSETACNYILLYEMPLDKLYKEESTLYIYVRIISDDEVYVEKFCLEEYDATRR